MAKNCEVCGREFDALYPKTGFEGHEVCKVCKTKLQKSDEPFEKTKEAVCEELKRCEDPFTGLEIIEESKGFPATTDYGFEGFKITDYLGLTGGEVALGTGFMTDMYAGLSDFFGTECLSLTDKVRSAKEVAQAKLIQNCKKLGANAVIGVDFEVCSSNYLIIVSANGTAVKIEKV